MSPRSKQEYRETVHLRYKKQHAKKTVILDEFCATCKCHRKHAIRVLRGFKRFTKPKPKRRGKPSIYQNEAITNPLKEIWLAANLPCSKRLKVMLQIWLSGYVETTPCLGACFKVDPSSEHCFTLHSSKIILGCHEKIFTHTKRILTGRIIMLEYRRR